MFNAFLEGMQKETEIQREVAVVQRERPRNEQASALAHETFLAVAGKRNRGVVSHNEDLPAVGVTHREVLELKVSIDGLAKKVNSDIDAILKLLESELQSLFSYMSTLEDRANTSDTMVERLNLEVRHMREESRQKDKQHRDWVIGIENAYRSLQKQMDVLRVNHLREESKSGRVAKEKPLRASKEEAAIEHFAGVMKHHAEPSISENQSIKKAEASLRSWREFIETQIK